MSETTPYTEFHAVQPASPCDPLANRIILEDFAEPGPAPACGFEATYWSNIGVDTRIDPLFYNPNTPEEPFDLPPLQVATPCGNDCAGHYFLPNGAPDESTPWQATRFEPAITEKYFDWYEWYQSPFAWANGQKLFRMFNSAGLPGNVQVNMEVVGNGSSLQLAYFHGADTQFLNVAVPPLDQWVHYQLYFLDATGIGSNDGRLVLWVNGSVLVDFNPTNRNSTVPVDGFWVGGNSSWGGSTVTGTVSRFISCFGVYSALPCNVTLP